MKNSISRQHIYLLSASFFLLLFVLLFSFTVLIPAGKEYRVKRVAMKKVSQELREYEMFHSETLSTLKEMQHKNRRVITSFDATFNPQKFEKQNQKFFSALHISSINFLNLEEKFAVYEVNTTSKISSPTSFYKFLDNINKSDWIIEVNFPIEFKRSGDEIKSSFTMKVYSNNKDTNTSTSASEAK